LILGDKFYESLREIRKDGVDLVCLTGDVADWGHPNEYAKATVRLKKILETVGVGPDKLFVVPGNHDIQRTVHPDAWKGIREWHDQTHDGAALGRWLASVGGPPPGIQADWRDCILKRQAAFWRWAKDFGCADIQPLAAMPLGYRHTLPAGTWPGIGAPIHIIGLDSAWLCGGDDDQGRILVTEEQVLAHVRDGEHALDGFRIAVVHHPLSELADRTGVWGLLADGGVDVLLHGHQHTPLASFTSVPGASLRTLAAGCLIEGDLGKNWPNGFQLIEVGVASKTCTVHFRKWARDASPKFWAKGSDVYRDALDGLLEWGAPVPGLHPAPMKNILLLASNPQGSSARLALDVKLRHVLDQLSASEYRSALKFQVRWASRPDDLLQALNETRPAVVHFVGHGAGSKGIILETASEYGKVVSVSALQRLFDTFGSDLRTVVLDGCYEASQATAIIKVVDSVVVIPDRIGDMGSRAFLASFYRAIGFGRSILDAFEQGLVAVALEGLGDDPVPTLLVRDGVDARALTVLGDEPLQAAELGQGPRGQAQRSRGEGAPAEPAATSRPPRVFLSYSHDSHSHRKEALDLAQRLRREGVDCQIDQFLLGGPSEGWPRWTQRQVEEVDFVLVVCTETYKRRFDGREQPGTGKGADWEGILVLQQLYDVRSINEKFIPVIFDGAEEEDIPLPLKPYTHYRIPGRYDDLHRFLTEQPKVVPGPVGEKKVMPPDPT